MSDYIPKVGERCLFPTGQGVMIVNEPDSNDIVIVKADEGEYRRVSVFSIKPLPTEEGKLVDEMCDVFPFDDSYERRLMCERLIKAGYRKVEPISFDDFRDMYHTYKDFDLYKKLINKNIIVKRG